MSPIQVTRDWWHGTRMQRLTVIAAAIGAIATAAIALLNLGQIGEPYWIATRGYTRALIERAQSSASGQILSVQIAIKESQRDTTQQEIDRLTAELAKDDNKSPSLIQLLNEQLSKYKQQLRDIEIELDDLRRLRNGRRPW